MQLARFLNKLFKTGGFVLIDADLNKYIIGSPEKDNPITLKLLDKKLHYKLLLYPDLYMAEAYADGVLKIENGINPSDKIDVEIKYSSGDIKKIKTLCRIDTKNELEYYKNGGILQFVLRNMM